MRISDWSSDVCSSDLRSWPMTQAWAAAPKRRDGARGAARDPQPMMRVLTFTALYPNAAQPVHGIFVENRIRHLRESGEVDIQVAAPVPWFPIHEIGRASGRESVCQYV